MTTLERKSTEPLTFIATLCSHKTDFYALFGIPGGVLGSYVNAHTQTRLLKSFRFRLVISAQQVGVDYFCLLPLTRSPPAPSPPDKLSPPTFRQMLAVSLTLSLRRSSGCFLSSGGAPPPYLGAPHTRPCATPRLGLQDPSLHCSTAVRVMSAEGEAEPDASI